MMDRYFRGPVLRLKVVYNLGRADEVDGEKMLRLAGSILRVFGDPTELSARDDLRLRDSWPYGGAGGG